MAIRTRFLAAAAFFLIAGMCAPMLESLGVHPQVTLWTTRFCGYTFLGLLGAYYFAYRRDATRRLCNLVWQCSSVSRDWWCFWHGLHSAGAVPLSRRLLSKG